MAEVIKLEDSTLDIVKKMSQMANGGFNPGAATVLMDILTKGKDIDGDDIFGGFGTILHMDHHEIRGEKIWMLYKDVCKQDLRVMIGLLRACQLGYLNAHHLDIAINNYGRVNDGYLDIAGIMKDVEDRLPHFQRGNSSAPASVPKDTILTKPGFNYGSPEPAPKAEIKREMKPRRQVEVMPKTIDFEKYKVFPKGKRFVVKRRSDNKLLKNAVGDYKGSVANFISMKEAAGCIENPSFTF